MKIRKRRTPKPGGGWYAYWQLDKGLVNGKRERVNFKSRVDAENALTTTRQERQRFGTEHLSLPDGVRVAMMAAHKRLAEVNATIDQATDFFLKYHHKTPDKRLDAAIVELIAAKRAANLRERYLKQLKFVCDRFATGRDERLIKEITREEIEEWLNGNGWAPKTRKGYLTDIQTLFAFAESKGWLIENPAVKIQKPRLDEGRPAILTAEQAAKLMSEAQEHDVGLCAYLGLALFAGIRPEEIDRLPKSAIDLRAKLIRIPAEVSKTRRERDVTIESNLKAWLKLGIELPVVNFKRRFDAVRDKAELREGWPHDVMRHTYGSFHVAKYHAVGRTALQMGNSEPVVHAHYLDHIRDKRAVTRFWNIKPKAKE